MAAEFQRLSDANDAKTAQVCSSMLSELWAPIHTKSVEGGVEGLESLLREWAEVCTAFKQRAPSGVDGTAVLNAFLATDVLADAVLAAQTLVDKCREAEKLAVQGRSEAEAKLVAALRDHMKEVGEAADEARQREETLRARAEAAENTVCAIHNNCASSPTRCLRPLCRYKSLHKRQLRSVAQHSGK